MLFYTTEGNLNDPDNVTIVCQDLYLLDIGTAAYTEWEIEPDHLRIYEQKEERMKWRSGFIHSHNNMPCFFSGDDNEEIEDNSVGVDYYLSLIVNNNNYKEWTSKIAIRGKEEIIIKRTWLEKLKDFTTKEYTTERDVLFILNPEIDIAADEALEEIVHNVAELEEDMSKRSSKKGKVEQNLHKPVEGFNPDEKVGDNEIVLNGQLQEDEEKLYTQMLMTQQNVITPLRDVILRMSSHLKPTHYAKFASRSAENALEMIEDFFIDDQVSGAFVMEIVSDFNTALAEIKRTVHPNAQELITEIIAEYENKYILAAQTDIDF